LLNRGACGKEGNLREEKIISLEVRFWEVVQVGCMGKLDERCPDVAEQTATIFTVSKIAFR